MKIDICSDLHFEFHRDDFPVKWDMPEGGDVLIVAGDYLPYKMIASPESCPARKLATDFFREAAEKYKAVFVVLGNHDYYGSAFDKYINIAVAEDAHHYFLHDISSKICLLADKDTKFINFLNCAFVGATLWGSWNQLRDLTKLCNDFGNIENWTQETFLQMADIEKCFLLDRIHGIPEETKTIVVTHFLPSAQCIAPKYAGHYLTDYFVNPCEDIIEKFNPALWVHGHTHEHSDTMIGKTRTVCNSWGYSTDRNYRTSFKRIEI